MNPTRCPHCNTPLGNFQYADACPHCSHDLEHNSRPRVAAPSRSLPHQQRGWPIRCLRTVMRWIEH